MVETGATPKVSFVRRQVTRIGRVMTNPLLPDDYFALVKPTWSTRETTGTVVRVVRQHGHAATVVVKPDFDWPGHTPGQYMRLGMEIDGVRHWRAYTITSDPKHPEGVVSVTVKHTEGGKMSPVFVQQVQVGQRVYLGEVEGEFTLPDPLPAKLLFISGGSGITPIMSMLRDLDRRDGFDDAIHIHSSRSETDMIFGGMLRGLAERRSEYQLKEIHTANMPRFEPDQLDDLCPDWREREVFLSGPKDMMDGVEERFEKEDRSEHLHTERFQPVIGNGGGSGSGGTIHFRVSDCDAECDSGQSILVGGENAGANLTFGCRMGVCHTCVGRLRDGAVRDLRTGSVEQASGQMVRVCINAPEGHVEIDL
ncbi:ferredoxin reductase [uncultured Jatrophihabitans sp.]|uniref:ferredoxin reductase n=1 Tax=uncultured Jatrophihabitans sp. TaxID=1610747 RepID=UPI0035CA7BCB